MGHFFSSQKVPTDMSRAITIKNYYEHFTDTKTLLDYIIELKDENNFKGALFEQFCVDWLKVHPVYGRDYSNVILSKDAPLYIWQNAGLTRSKGAEPLGIDSFGIRIDRYYDIIQSKAHNGILSPTVLGTFFMKKAEAHSTNGKVKNCYVMSTSKKLTDNLEKDRNDVIYLLYHDLVKDIGAMDRIKALYALKPIITPQLNLYEWQQSCVNAALYHFEKNHVGSILAACGLGKTRIAIEIASQLALQKGMKTFLITVPSIRLAIQTVKQWTTYFLRHDQPKFLVIASSGDQAKDRSYIVTENKEQIDNFFSDQESYKVAVCVYDSSEKLKEYPIDFLIADEAHHTLPLKNRYSIIESPNVKNKLFMTATKKLAQGELKHFCRSMDDKNIYGEVIYHRTIGEGIKGGHLNDYKIMVLGYDGDLPKRVHDNGTDLPCTYVMAIQGIKHAIAQGYRKIVTYNNKKETAKALAQYIKETFATENDIYVAELHSDMRNCEIEETFQQYRDAKIGILCTVKMLKEGIDIKEIDCVAFCDPRYSKIDLVQCIGRCLRYCESKTMPSLVIFPYYETSDNSQNQFKSIWETLKLLAEEDADIFDELILQISDSTNARKKIKSAVIKNDLIMDGDFELFEKFIEKMIITLLSRKDPLVAGYGDILFNKKVESLIDYMRKHGTLPKTGKSKNITLGPEVDAQTNAKPKCNAVTKDGKSCKNKQKYGEFCKTHMDWEVKGKVSVDVTAKNTEDDDLEENVISSGPKTNFIKIQENVMKNFSKLSDKQKDELWCFPFWNFETNDQNTLDEWNFVYNKLFLFCQKYKQLPDVQSGNEYIRRLGQWLENQNKFVAARNQLNAEQISKLKIIEQYGFKVKIVEFDGHLSPWQKVVYRACKRTLEKYGDIIAVSNLNKDIDTIVEEYLQLTGTEIKGPSPKNTLSRVLLELTNKGVLIRPIKGKYKINVELDIKLDKK